MERIAVIDLGSNSFHMVICEVSEEYLNPIKIVNEDDYKAYVRLGANLQKGDLIKEEKVKEIISILTRFKKAAEQHKARKIFCIATEALRRAGNGKEIMKLIKDQIGLHIELISGHEEAYLGFYGIVNSFALRSYLTVDIGGSSTELVYVKNRKLKKSISLPIGSLNICDLFDSTNTIEDELAQQMMNYFTEVLDDTHWLQEIEIDAIIGVGGTMRTIGKYERAKMGYPLSIQHNYQLDLDRVQTIFNDLRILTEEERLNLAELQKSRATIFPSALTLVLSIMKYVHNQTLILSKFGLREGFALDYILKGEIVKDVFERDVEQILFEQNISEKLYNHYLSRALSRCKPLIEEDQTIEIDEELIKISTVFLLKRQESDAKQIKKFLKYLFSRGIFGLTHQQMIMALMIADFSFDNKYKTILTVDDYELVRHIDKLNLFGE